MRDRMSRPSWSVPSQCAIDGVGWLSAARFVAFGGYGAMSGAVTAAAIQKTTIPAPIAAGVESVIRANRPAHRRMIPGVASSVAMGTDGALACMDTGWLRPGCAG